MSLAEIVDNERTDKNTLHSYLELYESLLNSKKNTAKNVLEIGINVGGGSIKLWHDYFQNANIYGLDIININDIWDGIKNNERIHLLTSVDAYDSNFFNETLFNQNKRFDMILDDGPHTLESMKVFVALYSQLLTEDGILILEDIQDISWVEKIKECIPDNLKSCVDVYDLRPNKGRYDDIVLTIDKSKNK